MRPLRRCVPLAAAAAVALAMGYGCGGDSSGPDNGAASVTGIAGDDQVGPMGGQLAFPLSFVVLDAGGQPIQGVSVTWTATPAGGATFTPSPSTTNTSGTASTVVTLGSLEGEIEIRGTVGGLAPVTFSATVVPPCEFFAPYTIGTIQSGTLTTADCNLGGWYYDLYGPVTAASQQGWTVSMFASFNTWVELFRGTGDILASTGSGSTASDAHIIVAPGEYVFGPSTLQKGITGSYTFSSAVRAQTLAGCEEVWVTRGVSIADNIQTTDCRDSSASGVFYGDLTALFADAGTVLTITQSSTELDAFLTLFQVSQTGDFISVASDDDGVSGTTDAIIQYTVPALAIYVIFPSTALERETGTYTLAVSASTTRSGSRVSAAGEPLQVAPLRRSTDWLRGRPLPSRRPSH